MMKTVRNLLCKGKGGRGKLDMSDFQYLVFVSEILSQKRRNTKFLFHPRSKGDYSVSEQSSEKPALLLTS